MVESGDDKIENSVSEENKIVEISMVDTWRSELSYLAEALMVHNRYSHSHTADA